MKNHPQILTVFCLLKFLSWCPALPQTLARGAVTVGTASQTAEETQYIRVPTSLSKQITSLQFLTLQGEMGSEEQGTLPCLDSSKECVEELTQQAIAAAESEAKAAKRGIWAGNPITPWEWRSAGNL